MQISPLPALEETSGGPQQLVPLACLESIGETEHFVQFYESDAFLADCVAAYAAGGLRAGDAVVIIATDAHRETIEAQLAGFGLDVAAARESGQYLALNAAETLSKFMVNGTPDQRLFIHVIGSVITAAARGRRVRAFGEMVALLWADGKSEAALRLEALWNELAKVLSFSLFCAYPLSNFKGERNGQPFLHVCREHSRVIPAESYSARPSVDDRLRTISVLQQKAASMEAEIVERQRAESALREQQTKLTMAVALARVGIWELDLMTNTLTCSDECKGHFGLQPSDDLNYDRFLQLVHPDDRETVQNAFRIAIAADGDQTTEFRVLDPSGELRWIASMGRCFHNGHHRMLGVTLDITQRRRRAELLEQMVAERTAKLRETVAELEAFSYSVSHDLRAPLRSMQGFAEIIFEECGEDLRPEGRLCLERISASAERMDRLIRDVLAFSRVARTEFTLDRVNMDRLVRTVIDSYPNLQAPHANIIIRDTLPSVLGNQAALTQCFSNLLSNAVKFVAAGTQPTVRIWGETLPKTDEGGTKSVRIYIQDNGIGIPAESQERIFGMFQRLSTKYEGTGIGLAIVRKAIERLGGRVGLTSEPGKGSTFWIELKSAA